MLLVRMDLVNGLLHSFSHFLQSGVITVNMSKLNVTTSSTRPASPNTGSIFFETDTNKLIFWDGTVWHEYHRDSVTAAPEPNTLQFSVTFNNTVGGHSESNLTFASDASHVSPDYAGAGTLASYSAQGVGSSNVKFFVVWEDNAHYNDAMAGDYDWAGWSLFSSTDDGVNLTRELFDYSGMQFPIQLLTLNKTAIENVGGTWNGWDHGIEAPFNMDLATSSNGDFHITYDGNGQDGEFNEQYLVNWDGTGALSMNGGTSAADFASSRTGTVPS